MTSNNTGVPPPAPAAESVSLFGHPLADLCSASDHGVPDELVEWLLFLANPTVIKGEAPLFHDLTNRGNQDKLRKLKERLEKIRASNATTRPIRYGFDCAADMVACVLVDFLASLPTCLIQWRGYDVRVGDNSDVDGAHGNQGELACPTALTADAVAGLVCDRKVVSSHAHAVLSAVLMLLRFYVASPNCATTSESESENELNAILVGILFPPSADDRTTRQYAQFVLLAVTCYDVVFPMEHNSPTVDALVRHIKYLATMKDQEARLLLLKHDPARTWQSPMFAVRALLTALSLLGRHGMVEYFSFKS
eukprot:TRINITY_DN1169_c0_g2_i1.p1 TRINITY_DN1169_c0_g2~~TRINITY_DN1169_c0_g2_i1.p1  ORF type:complete len:308 (-),score=55.42 TRINITY_DN1169_c0_g2_i1:53-976(-)